MNSGKPAVTTNQIAERAKQITVAPVTGIGIDGFQKWPYITPNQVEMISSRQHSKKSLM